MIRTYMLWPRLSGRRFRRFPVCARHMPKISRYPSPRLVHRCKALKDNDLVPDDSVDDGEQDQVEEVLGGGGLDLSYLWLLDARNLEPRTPNATSPTGDPSGPAAKKQDSPSSTISTATQVTDQSMKSMKSSSPRCFRPSTARLGITIPDR